MSVSVAPSNNARPLVAPIRHALIAACVRKERILSGAYGELNLECAQDAEDCWQQNRRVEIESTGGGTVRTV